MRKALISTMILCFALTLSAQTGTTTPKKTAPPSGTAGKKPTTKTLGIAPGSSKPTTAASTAEPTAILHTTAGDLKCTLFPKQAPKTVDNFIGLATGSKQWTDPKKGTIIKGKPLYDGVLFHRVIPNFMVQTGDPIGNGTGGPGYKFEDEFVPELRFDQPGRLAMANSGPATNGSQFFITEVPTPWLNDRHTIFGQCDDASVEKVKEIARVATDPRNNRPDQDIKITHIEIVGAGKPAAPPVTKPAAKKPATATKAPAKASPTKN